jgi:hypothetical protein
MNGRALTALTLEYPAILDNFGDHLIPGRLESRAFLGWFLEHYYRLDETDAQDSICDGSDDKGIDGIYIDENLERVDVFQTKLFQRTTRTLGDTQLKEFAGTLDQVRDAEGIEKVISETGNPELRGLLIASNAAALVRDGYTIRGIFVTNVPLDANGQNYLAGRSDMTIVDSNHLIQNWVAPGDNPPIEEPVSFHVGDLGIIQYETPEAEVFMAPLLAKDLVNLGGLESQELFAWNVRQTLGKTKVNKAIAESVGRVDEHKNFLLYHNGLTILAETVDLNDDSSSLTVSGYNVVNGCQSLSTLFENKHRLTDDLRLLARVIKLAPQTELAAKITRHSNNQNSVSARDLQSNSTIQRRLQQEFRDLYGDAFGYEIKRGETSTAAQTITNEAAAKLLLAFDLGQPWACHQSYRLFDELHSDIFGRPEVSASRIAALHSIQNSIDSSLDNLSNKLFASYSLTRFFVLYLVNRALAVDDEGAKFAKDPRAILQRVGEAGLEAITTVIVGDLLVDLDAELNEREADGRIFDYKRDLKSPSAVRDLANQILPSYEKAIRRGRATSFSVELDALEIQIANSESSD